MIRTLRNTAAVSAQSGPDLIASANGSGPLARLRGSDQSLFAARWHHEDCRLPVTGAAQNILCFHESGTTNVDKYEDGKLAGTRSVVGTVTFIPCDGTVWEIHGECQVLHVYLAPSLIAECAAQLDAPRTAIASFFSQYDPWLAGFFKMLAAECELYGDEVDSLLLSQSQSVLIAHLLRWHARPGEQQSPRTAQTIAPRRLRAVVDYMQANLSKSMTLKELADLACLSEFHFARCFKDATGSSPYRYLLERRIATAAGLLTTDDRPIKTIAYAVGFSSARHFSASFKATLGKSPLEYRRDNGRSRGE
ncbi:helix-turn-helix domain-containing protein [Paraburkholderia tropica]|uniref:helix-turn-helix domain-containing protein n=1 Tax=Paraburkholderia tropica TaxID=92647 RepID=UPI002ABD26B9|nr:helix-turn-helix domain-containing protein [Paraburkholderia tropica]